MGSRESLKVDGNPWRKTRRQRIPLNTSQNEGRSGPVKEDVYAKGCRLTRAGKLEEAVGVFTKAIEIDNHRAEAYFRRGVCHYRLGNYHLAVDDMDAATVLGCQDAQMWSRHALQMTEDTVDDPTLGRL